jgi:hypothetical protein
MSTRHERRKAEAVKRQLDRQKELRDNALFYAAAGERVAAYTVALIDVVVELVTSLPKRPSKATHALIDEVVGMVFNAQDELEPFRGRVCMDLLDELVAAATSDSEDDPGHGPTGGDEPNPEPPQTPVPDAFVKALAP